MNKNGTSSLCAYCTAQNFGRFGTARKLAEKTLAVDHTNNSLVFELISYWWIIISQIHQNFLSPRLCAVQYLEGFGKSHHIFKTSQPMSDQLDGLHLTNPPANNLIGLKHSVHTMVLILLYNLTSYSV